MLNSSGGIDFIVDLYTRSWCRGTIDNLFLVIFEYIIETIVHQDQIVKTQEFSSCTLLVPATSTSTFLVFFGVISLSSLLLLHVTFRFSCSDWLLAVEEILYFFSVSGSPEYFLERFKYMPDIERKIAIKRQQIARKKEQKVMVCLNH